MKMMKVHRDSVGDRSLVNVPDEVPLRLLNEQWALRNHSQTLAKLNSRGGLCVIEILDIIHERSAPGRKETQADVDELNDIIDNALGGLVKPDTIMKDQKEKEAESHPDMSDATETKKVDATPKLTFGQQLVGLTFNPSGDPKVNRAKELCAELADLLNDHTYSGEQEISRLQSKLHDHAVGEILNAQMNVVKVLTLKY